MRTDFKIVSNYGYNNKCSYPFKRVKSGYGLFNCKIKEDYIDILFDIPYHRYGHGTNNRCSEFTIIANTPTIYANRARLFMLMEALRSNLKLFFFRKTNNEIVLNDKNT